MWLKELKRSRPIWGVRKKGEVPKTQLAQKYGARLLNATAYRNKIIRGPLPDQTVDQYVQDLQQCFKITEAGENEQLLTEYRQQVEEMQET